MEIRAGWVKTFANVAKNTGVGIEVLKSLDIFDFFTLLKTIKKDGQ